MPFLNRQIDSSWKAFADDLEIQQILADIEKSISNARYYPLADDVLRFMEVDASAVKHVIVGMDPYPSWNEKGQCPQATGRSFEVSELYGKGWDYKFKQSSLRNILKAVFFNETERNASLSDIRNEIKSERFSMPAPTQWFDEMEEQGVLFLNSTLTVEAGKPGSHRTLWADFREFLAKFIIETAPNAKWHLWGNDAQDEYSVLVPENSQLGCCHPRLAQFVEENTLKFANDVSWTGKN